MELEDWELLQNSPRSIENESPRTPEFHEIQQQQQDEEEKEEGEPTHSMIRADHFSLDKPQENTDSASDSDGPSWIDPAHQFQGDRVSAEFWSDSASDRSDDRKVTEFSTKAELGIGEFEKGISSLDGIGKLEAEKDKSLGLGIGIEGFGGFEAKKEIDYVEGANIRGYEEDSGKFWSDSGGDRVGLDENVVKRDVGDHDDVVNETDSAEKGEGVEMKDEAKAGGGDGEKKSVVWWKMPFEFFKYCVFRVSPFWSFSMAAAFMGFVILARRLYKMKRKTRTLQLKVTVDEKKVSQFMSRAARLNEAFSVVRRVPVVRPALPAAGVTPWPVMSLR